MSEGPAFRPAKRRQVYRLRSDWDSLDSSSVNDGTGSLANPHIAAQGQPSESPEDVQDGAPEPSVRTAKTQPTRKIGITFDGKTNPPPISRVNDVADAEVHKISSAVDIAASRFTHQTGHKVDNQNKHIDMYIDAKLAESSAPVDRPESGTSAKHIDMTSIDPTLRPASTLVQGKIAEVNLGDDEVRRNVERTAAATKEIHGQSAGAGRYGDSDQQRPSRLGPDGKPWRSRRRRRNSDDIARDQLVEAILKESRLEVYDSSSAQEPTKDDGEAADERMAEQFRKQFFEDVAARNYARTVSGTTNSRSEPSKGPKLGGSRSARAAMRAQGEEAKKR